MSDSFADLWSSTAPSNTQNLPLSQQKKPAVAGISQQKPGQDLFSLLSSTSSTPSYVGASRMQSSSSLNAAKTGSRPITPSMAASNPGTRPGSSLSQTKASNGGSDAFGDLLSGIGSSKSGKTENMTMAERAALAQKQRLATQTNSNHLISSQSQWAGLDALGAGSSSTAPSKPGSTSLDAHDWGLGEFAAPPKPSSAATSALTKSNASQEIDDDWGLGDFGSPSSQVSRAPVTVNTRKSSQNKPGTLWDLEDVVSTSSKPQEHVDSPDFDFDFGNREYTETPPVQDHPQHDEDDVLGLLSKPVDAVRSTSRQSSEPRPLPTARQTSHSSRTSSPPPHILGQIVEMGFSIPQARAALARTESGVDVQAALDLLLAESSEPEAPPPRSRPQRDYSDEGASRHQPSPPQRDENGGTPNAEKFIAQASEIGLSVLSKASLFWKEGKEKVQKAYEEANKSAANTTRDSRPRWMQEASGSREPQTERERPAERRPAASTFRDDNDIHEESSAFSEAPPPAARPSRPQQLEAPRRTADLLFSAEEPKAYVSPFRRKKAEGLPSSAASPAPAPPRQAPAAPKPKPKRHLPFCPTSTLSRVQQHKTKGTDAFKLGQFSVAADEYTKAITLLPGNHLLLVPLQTNRAIAYIRCGECKSAIEDAGGALAIIGSIQGQGSWESWHPSDEDGGWDLESGSGGVSEADGRGGYTVTRAKGSEWTDSWGRGVDLKDGWVKAVKRRAEALEGLEKWKEAKKDWEVLAGGGGGGWVASSTRQEAVRGLGRCKKIIEGGDTSTPKPAQAARPKPKPRPVPMPSVNATPGIAVEAYRAQVNAQEAEDALKHSLKDNVEEKLQAWKKGKESNLRALLASLDTILWDEVLKEMGKKPGMADLVSAGGVKKWYMKAVSRVHPDKLNANNSTVEQRMIAGGVFGALNEAWLAFKP